MKHVTRKLFKVLPLGEWLVTSKGNSVRIFYGLRGTTNVALECIFPDLLPRWRTELLLFVQRPPFIETRYKVLSRDYAETNTDL